MITSLRLQNFRSYDDSSFEFEPGVNIIVGPNGSGKTNLLEALLMVARGKTYRSGNHVINNSQAWARLDAVLAQNTRTLKLKRVGDKTDKQFTLDGTTKKRLGPRTSLPTVVFEPNHLQLIGGDPGLRREFLDDLSAKLNPESVLTQRAYKRTLAQRNALLKTGATADKFFVWDVRLAELAEGLVAQRLSATTKINQRLLETYKKLGGHAKSLKAVYEPGFMPERYGEQFMKYLSRDLELDRARGFTGRGPHREDIVVFFDKVDARTRASRGEVRTLLLALKIIEMELAQVADAPPILLFDDVFSELDGKRRRALAEELAGYQTFITTTDADIVVDHFQGMATIIPIT